MKSLHAPHFFGGSPLSVREQLCFLARRIVAVLQGLGVMGLKRCQSMSTGEQRTVPFGRTWAIHGYTMLFLFLHVRTSRPPAPFVAAESLPCVDMHIKYRPICINMYICIL